MSNVKKTKHLNLGGGSQQITLNWPKTYFTNILWLKCQIAVPGKKLTKKKKNKEKKKKRHKHNHVNFDIKVTKLAKKHIL